MKLHDQGEDVRQLQLALMARGVPLPRYGADGDFGNETATALSRFARAVSIPWVRTEPVPEALLVELGTVPSVQPPAAVPLEIDVPLYDLRGEQLDRHPKGKTGRDGKTIRRAPAAVDGIMLHQAAVEFDRPKKDKSDLGLARRALGVACHAMAFRSGFAAAAAPLDYYVQHGNNLNSSTLGLEVDGHYPGLRGRKLKDGSEPTPESELTIAAACAALHWLVNEGRAAGMPIRFIYAHRQADSWRRADPGEWIWRRVALAYGVEVLGLEPRQEQVWRNVKGPARRGKPVPIDWDPNGVGRY